MSILQKKGDKITFHIEVKKLTLKKATALERDTALNVCVERGKHLLTTNDKTALVTKEGDFAVNFNETLILDATLYKTNSGLYQDKPGKIMVRKKKKGFMVSGYQAIGTIDIKLNELLDEVQPFEKVYLLKDCAFPGSSLHVKIHLSDENGSVDDDVSIHSSNTAPSVPAAARRPSELTTADNNNKAPPSDTTSTGNKRSGSLSITPPTAVPPAAPAAPSTPPPKVPPATSDASPTDPFATNGSGSKSGDPFGDFDPFASAAVGTPGGAADDWGAAQQDANFDWPASEAQSFGGFTPTATPNKLPPPVPASKPPTVPIIAAPGASPASASASNAARTSHHSSAGVSDPFSVGSESSMRHAKPVRSEAPPIPTSLPSPAPHVPFSTSAAPPIHDPTSSTGIASGDSSDRSRPSAAATAGSSELQQLQEQLDFVKSVVVLQENKLHQASEFIAYQDNQIKTLQQQDSGMPSASTDGSSGSEKTQQMEQVIIIQETKLQQAAEFIDFQNAEIQRLNEQVESLMNSNHQNHHSSAAEGGDNADLEALQLKLKQASEYIEFQDTQLAEANATIETLRAAASGDVDVVELQTKLQQAAEYITFQTEELENAKQQIACLQESAAASSGSGTGSNAEMEEKLKQAAEYISYQETTIAELNEQLAAANAAASAGGSAGVGAGLISDKEIITQLQLKLMQSVEYIEQLKKEAKDATAELQSTKEQLDVMITYSNSNTPNITPNKGPGGRPQSVPVINEEMSSKLKVILNLKEQLETVTEELRKAELKLTIISLNGNGTNVPPAAAANTAPAVSEEGESMEEMKQKLEQAKEFIAFQQQQIDDLNAAGGGAEAVEELNEKVTQAKEYIAYQTEQLSALQSELDALKEKHSELQALKHKDDHLLAMLKSELESVKGQLLTNSATAHDHEAADHAAMQVKLDQAKEFIEYQTVQIEALKEQLGSASGGSGSHTDEEFTAMQETLNSAKEFTEFQSTQLESLTKEVSALNQQLREANEKLAEQTAKVIELTAAAEVASVAVAKAQENELKLQQAADFIAFQSKKLEECEDYLKTVNELMAKHQEDELKLKQAAEFISFQSKQIEELSALDTSEQQAVIASENDELNTKLQQAAEFVAFQTKQITELTENVEQLTTVNTANDEKLAQAKEYIDYMNKQAAEQTAEIETLKAEVAASAEKLSNHDEMLAKLDQAAKYIEYQTGEMAELTDQIEAQSKEIATLKAAAESHKGADKKLEKLDAKLKSSLATVESQTAELSTLKHQVAGLTQTNHDLEAKLAAAENQKKESAQQVAQLELYISEVEDKLEVQAKTIAAHGKGNNSNNAAIVAALQKENEELKQDIEERDGELAKLKETLLKSSTAASNLSISLETRLKQSAEQIEQLKAQLAAKEAEAAKAAAAGKSNESKQLADLNTKLKQAADYIQQQKNQLEEASQTITSMQDTIDRLTESGTTSQADQEKLQQAAEYINYQREQMAQLSEEVNRVSAEYEGVNQALLAAQQEVTQLKQQLQQQSTTPSKKTNPFAPAAPVSPTANDNKKELQAMVAQYDALLAEKDAEMLTLTTKIAELTAASGPQRNGSNAGNALDKQQIAQYQSTLNHVAEKLVTLIPKQSNVKLDYDLNKISPQEASRLLMGLTDTIIGFYKDKEGAVTAAASTNGGDTKKWEAKLAEKDAEAEKLLQNLIETKMMLAQISGELDQERKTCTQLKRQLGVGGGGHHNGMGHRN